VVSPTELARLEASLGRRLSPKAHPWWALRSGVARAYGVTEPRRKDRTIPVLLTAEMEGGPPVDTPALPSVAKDPGVTLTLTSVARL